MSPDRTTTQDSPAHRPALRPQIDLRQAHAGAASKRPFRRTHSNTGPPADAGSSARLPAVVTLSHPPLTSWRTDDVEVPIPAATCLDPSPARWPHGPWREPALLGRDWTAYPITRPDWFAMSVNRDILLRAGPRRSGTASRPSGTSSALETWMFPGDHNAARGHQGRPPRQSQEAAGQQPPTKATRRTGQHGSPPKPILWLPLLRLVASQPTSHHQRETAIGEIGSMVRRRVR
jgi:hypothetical protein